MTVLYRLLRVSCRSYISFLSKINEFHFHVVINSPVFVFLCFVEILKWNSICFDIDFVQVN